MRMKVFSGLALVPKMPKLHLSICAAKSWSHVLHRVSSVQNSVRNHTNVKVIYLHLGTPPADHKTQLYHDLIVEMIFLQTCQVFVTCYL